MDIQIKRGSEAKRTSITPKVGEPIMTTDTKELFIGDGTTAGGIAVGTVKTTGSVTADSVALFADATGKLLKSIPKATFLNGYATTASVTAAINSAVPGIKVNNAVSADSSKDALKLNGRSDYLTDDVLTSSYLEDDVAKIVTAAGVKALHDKLNNGKIDKTSITAALNDTSTSKVLSALGAKTLKDAIDTIQSSLQSTSQIATSAKQQTETNKLHLSRLPNQITKGIAAPVNGTGQDGDVYLQYK